MPVIATLAYEPGPAFTLTRAYMWGFAVGWWDNTTLVTAGNPSVFREVPFGGYELHLKFKDWFFEWGNKSIELQDLFEDFYITPPGGGAPVAPFPALIQYEVVENWHIPCVTIGLFAPDNYYWFQRFAAPDRPYWQANNDTAPASPFPFDDTP